MQNDRYVTQWLKQQVFVLPPALLAEATGPGEERAATNSPNDALEAMSTFWKRIWNRDALPEELQRLRSQQLPSSRRSNAWILATYCRGIATSSPQKDYRKLRARWLVRC